MNDEYLEKFIESWIPINAKDTQPVKEAKIAARTEFVSKIKSCNQQIALAAYDRGWEDRENQKPVSLVGAIEFRQDQNDWNDTKMAAMLDMGKTNFSEFKHGKRGLPINSIRKAYAIGIPASILLADDIDRNFPPIKVERQDKTNGDLVGGAK
jgi:hypothetical protein